MFLCEVATQLDLRPDCRLSAPVNRPVFRRQSLREAAMERTETFVVQTELIMAAAVEAAVSELHQEGTDSEQRRVKRHNYSLKYQYDNKYSFI